MKLLTKELEKRFKQVWSQEDVEDPIVIAKFFHPASNITRYATEYYPEDKTIFWYVDSDFGERWYSSLEELWSIIVRWLKIERDLYRDEKPLVILN